MTTTVTDHVEPSFDESRTEALAERIFGSLIAGAELLSIELGRRLGLYPVLAEAPVDAVALASLTGIAERYAEEWLTQQAAAGFVERDADGRYRLPAEHVPVLVDEDSPAFELGAAPLLFGLADTLPAVADAYVAGTGVEFGDFGAEFREGLASLNRPGFLFSIRDWIGEMPDVAARLDAGDAIVLDAGCGLGWSSIGLAKAFPHVRVVGVDLDRASIDVARANAEAAGVADRVRFIHANATDEATLRAASPDGYELVTCFQALHDMGEPDVALEVFDRLLDAGGTVLVGDEHAGEEPQAPAEPVERMQTAFSALHCLPATWAESTRIVNGTVLRPRTMTAWAHGAGFTGIEVLDIEHPFWRFYRLD